MLTTPTTNSNSHEHDICVACGTYYPRSGSLARTNCAVCDDERQYIPVDGQSFTTLSAMRQHQDRIVFSQVEEGIYALTVEPKFAIGQRAYLIQTENGNVLWDCIPYLDEEAIQKITELGGIRSIIISHPHYYSAHKVFSDAFGCQIFAHVHDRFWTDNAGSTITLFEEPTYSPLPGVTAIRCGGHFAGSTVLHVKRPVPDNMNRAILFTADTIMVNADRKSFSFMYSYPNYIPLPPEDISGIWEAVYPFEFDDAYGAFQNQFVKGEARRKVWESARRYLRYAGWKVSDISSRFPTLADSQDSG
ncbi:beta-lactamase-like protein [Gaertneriomyces semiglobifer]|nr:beta-lactamase-like protein [Gaertneriomyces semiglobifer]